MRWFLVFAFLFGCVAQVRAADCVDNFENCLVYGSPEAGEVPARWVYEPESGKTLSATSPRDGITLQCVRENITFQPDGSISYVDGSPPQQGCASVDRPELSGLNWKRVTDARLKTVSLEVAGGDEAPCQFSVHIDLDSEPATLDLSTRCRQPPGQVVVFRYYLVREGN